MRIDGRWHLFRDGVLRPVVDAAVQTPSGSWQAVMFLLDAGADRTVFDQTFLSLLAALALPADDTPELGGVGGKVDCLFIQSRLVLSHVQGDGPVRASLRGRPSVATLALSAGRGAHGGTPVQVFIKIIVTEY